VKTKEDVDLAVDKAVESGLINFGQKSWYQTIQDIVHKELNCFAEGNTILNDKPLFKRRKHNKA
jgi:hypothetical protein